VEATKAGGNMLTFRTEIDGVTFFIDISVPMTKKLYGILKSHAKNAENEAYSVYIDEDTGQLIVY
jgi:hypothetical protein